jgi:hypothetical protein
VNAFAMIAQSAKHQNNIAVYSVHANLCDCGTMKWLHYSCCALCRIKADEGSG